MARFLLLQLEAPLTSFGGVSIDAIGAVVDFPGLSMITGLIGCALGLERSDARGLDALQARLEPASALVRPGTRAVEYQSAQLYQGDIGWTTWGEPVGRAASPSYKPVEGTGRREARGRKGLNHQRYIGVDQDSRTLVAVRVSGGAPDLDALAAALERPSRVLYIGRRAQLPSRPVLLGTAEAPSPLAAISRSVQVHAPGADAVRIQWPAPPGLVAGPDPVDGLDPRWRVELVGPRSVTDIRRHATRTHGGSRRVFEGRLVREPRPTTHDEIGPS